MKRYLSLLLILAVTVCSAQINSIDIQHVTLNLRFDWEKKQAYGTVSILVSAKEPITEIALDGRHLSINKITNKEGKKLKYKYEPKAESKGLKITLDRLYKSGEEVTLEINYHTNWQNLSDPQNIWGSFGKGIRFFEPTTTEPNRQKQIWSTGEPESNQYWFPSIDNPDDLRTTTFKATIAKPLKVISNGVLQEKKDNEDGTQTFIWETSVPYANHLTSFVAGRYVDVTQQFEDVEIHNFCYQHEADATAASVVSLPEMMKFYSEFTGVQYPYPSYTQVFVQDFGGWMGNRMMSTITENMVDDYVTHKDFKYLWDITESEALATQWFGNLVSVKDWSHAWLSRSFARHLSGLYNEYQNDKEEFLVYQHQPEHTTYLSDWNSDNRQPIVNPDHKDSYDFINSNYPYLRGSSVLHMLRKHVGDEKWKSVIQKYVLVNRNNTVLTSDFQEAVETVYGEKMDWFFDQWIYGMGHPVFEVSKDWDERKNSLTLIVKQVQKLDESKSSGLFRGKMQIEIDGAIEEILLERYEENRFVFELPSKPNFVNFDFESTWIKEVTFEKSFEELLYQFQNSKDILARTSAMNQLSAIASERKTSTADKEKICKAYRDNILNHPYWRMRMLTLWQLQGLLLASDPDATFDKPTIDMLLGVIKEDESWVKSSAIWFLGMTKDPKYDQIYIDAFEDWSDRVTNAAAIALGKTKSEKAYNALIQLKDKPSWKNQSLISTLNGLQQLGDSRGVELALSSLINAEEAHWTLGTPVWDHRLAAANALVALGEAAQGYPLILDQFSAALLENNMNDIFYNVLQVVTLADPRGQEIFDMLKEKFKGDEYVMAAVTQMETQFQSAIK